MLYHVLCVVFWVMRLHPQMVNRSIAHQWTDPNFPWIPTKKTGAQPDSGPIDVLNHVFLFFFSFTTFPHQPVKQLHQKIHKRPKISQDFPWKSAQSQVITWAALLSTGAPRLVRPETRAAFGTGSLLEHFAPGDAVVLRWADWGLLRLCRRREGVYKGGDLVGKP